MPHLVIEYSQKLEDSISIAALVSNGQQAMSETGLFNASAIKTRALPYRDFVLGKSHEGSSNLFIHAEVRILEGRTTEQKEALSAAIFNYLCESAPEVPEISVEVRDMHKASYSKRVPF
ncbi:5-carboxymethyl-2-hydroxymuconate Delta-isomerase [Microbulbifer sp. CAU 1566]|uniref:5-carboxymethyl-2-hydroxymuconate Delta-isomerase n=1 Tax=unclassified Microbulbifer TaxID=2619833 RepID=UPI0013580332|nr:MULTISPECIES: 5-carboxymethyl-2-hydroxymuconate Delta-isomerase [unclassified Microbulbifer]MCK7595793.1 5-carboxymethyl-2-hydroxymuconate Delta-isomerase [Microbulbifer sp. CAU 1566]